MPELPEVESLRLGLVERIIGSKILKVEIIKPKIISGNGTIRKIDKKKILEFEKGVQNKKIKNISRIAKNLIIHLNNDSVLVVHLKMTGQLVFEPTPSPSLKFKEGSQTQKVFGGHPIVKSIVEDLPNKHTAIIFTLNNGTVFYNDVRMFGYVLYYKNLLIAREKGHFKNIGLEPFEKDFTLPYFKNEIKNKNKNLKSVLLDQSIVNGCGNIYADEICFASKVLPTRNCKSLTLEEIALIYKNIKKILALAIKHGGSSISNYLLADGSRGNYARLHTVYGRSGQKCKICKNILEKETVGGRTTVFCKVCQK